MDASLALFIWLAAAGVALSAAQLILWRTRRVLSRARNTAPVPATRSMPAAITESARTEMASSVTAL